ncbi:MAG: hypothetical protein AAFR58_08515 [Cyanobacteria bacterium J06627_28]
MNSNKFNGSININQLKQAAHHSPEQRSRSHLKPGRFVRLKGQPQDLPDFVLERYLGTFCWIRQQAWGQVIWKVSVARIAD